MAQPARAVRGAPAQGDPRACSSTGATAPTASRCGCSAPGRRCRPVPRRSPRRPARSSRRSPSAGTPAGRLRDRGARARSPSRPPIAGGPPAGDPADRGRPRGDDRAPRPSSGTASSRCGPTTRPRRRALEARATASGGPTEPHEAGRRPRPIPPRSRPRDRRDRGDRRRDRACAARSWWRGAWLASHLPERPLVAAAESAGELWYRHGARPARPGAGEPARASARAWPRAGAGRRRPPCRAPIPTPSSASSARRSGTPPATTSRSPAPAPTTSRPRSPGSTSRRPTRSARRSARRRPVDHRRACTTAPSSCPSCSCPTSSGSSVTAPMETVADPASSTGS